MARVTSGRLALKGLLAQLESGERTATAEETSATCSVIVECGRSWPTDLSPDDLSVVDRLIQQLPKFTTPQQRRVVGSIRPLRDHARRKVAAAAKALNKWLSEVHTADGGVATRLADLFQSIVTAYWLTYHSHCEDAAVKAQFILAVASVLCAVFVPRAPLHEVVAGEPRVQLLGQTLVDNIFVLPEHGNVLCSWYHQRLDRYNRTWWRVGRRAATRLREDFQVRLAMAFRDNAHAVAGREQPELKLEIRPWPMSGCPLARSFLEFAAQRHQELGDLGSPSLAACPPHSLRPETLRRILARLEAFELLDPGTVEGASPTSLGFVRLRWEAVTALTLKAFCAKPQATAASTTAVGEASPGSGGRAPTAKLGSSADRAPDGAPKPAARRDEDGFLARLVRRGLRAKDPEFAQDWAHFCRQRRVSPDFERGAHSPDFLADFVRRWRSGLLKKAWAADLLYKPEALSRTLQTLSGARASRPPGVFGAGSKRKASDGESSRSPHRHGKKGDVRRHWRPTDPASAKLSFGDYYGRSRKASSKVLMMNQMVGMSMMMHNPLAATMMGHMARLARRQAKKSGGNTAQKKGERLQGRADDKAKRDAREHGKRPREASPGRRRKGNLIDTNDL